MVSRMAGWLRALADWMDPDGAPRVRALRQGRTLFVESNISIELLKDDIAWRAIIERMNERLLRKVSERGREQHSDPASNGAPSVT